MLSRRHRNHSQDDWFVAHVSPFQYVFLSEMGRRAKGRKKAAAEKRESSSESTESISEGVLVDISDEPLKKTVKEQEDVVSSLSLLCSGLPSLVLEQRESEAREGARVLGHRLDVCYEFESCL